MGLKENAKEYFLKGKYNCCQAVICAYCDQYGIPDDAVFAMTEGMGQGMGGLKDTCGAVTGMFMAISMHNSAGDKFNPRKTKAETYEEVRKAASVFKEITGSIYCRELKGSPDRPAVPCDKCVEIAAAYVENYIENHK